MKARAADSSPESARDTWEASSGPDWGTSTQLVGREASCQARNELSSMTMINFTLGRMLK